MINKIKKYELCLGCGICESILADKGCRMELNNKGFYMPKFPDSINKDDIKQIKRLCPGIHVETSPSKGEWGKIKAVVEAWAIDKNIRHRAASGGVVTSLAIFLLEQHKVDAVLQVGVCNDSYLYNELKVSRTREEILCNAQSRYAPALIFNRIKQIFEESDEIFVFIGKPCDIAAMRNFITSFPKYKKRIKYFISIFCAGMPSYEATKKIWMQSGHKDAPQKLKYRGDGWPGNFTAEFKDGSKYEITYNESWGTVLNKHLPFRCKICPDGIGMLADLAVGDSWNTKDGYPDFTEAEGKSFCLLRSEEGGKLMEDAEALGYIEKHALDINNIKDKQKYQYERRKLTGWRMIPIQIVTGCLLRFKGLGIFRQAMTANYNNGLRNAIGTYIRLMKL